MIPLHELRLGNYVKYPNHGLDPVNLAYCQIGKIDSINNNGVTIVNDMNVPDRHAIAPLYSSEDLDSIELSDDLLRNHFHFERIPLQPQMNVPLAVDYYQRVFDGLAIKIKNTQNGFGLMILSDNEQGYATIPVNVHRLQNIIQDITGIVEDIELV